MKSNQASASPESLFRNHSLIFPMSNVSTEGEMLNRSQVAHYKRLQFAVRNGNVALKGSLHKYFEGGTNYGDFTVNDVCSVVSEISDRFEFDSTTTPINFIEFGLNISVDKDPTELIKSFILYRNYPFTPMHVKEKGYGRKCEMQQFEIKVYNKSLQYGLPYNLLRFEVKVKRMKFLERYGIFNLALADLIMPSTYSAIKEMLLDVLGGTLMFDRGIDIDSIPKLKERYLFLEGQNSEYWQGGYATQSWTIEKGSNSSQGESIHSLDSSCLNRMMGKKKQLAVAFSNNKKMMTTIITMPSCRRIFAG